MTSINVFDFLIIFCGLYMAYTGVLMKTKGKINTGVVLSRNVDPDTIKDKEGFIKYMWSKLLALGLLCASSGIFNVTISTTIEQTEKVVMVQLIMNAFFFVLLIIYTAVVMKAQKRFLR